MLSLQQQHAVVIGGTSGIGYAAAKAVADLGAEVTIIGRDAQKLEMAASQLGSRARGVRADARDRQQVEGAFKRIGQFGREHAGGTDRDCRGYRPCHFLSDCQHLRDGCGASRRRRTHACGNGLIQGAAL